MSDFNLRGNSNPEGKQTIVAVDLSIWICEGIASTALSTFHSYPALYLVYQQTTKLIFLGLGLVFVVEGQRCVLCLEGQGGDNFAVRRQTTTPKARMRQMRNWARRMLHRRS
jgi:hypothetical protein